MATHQKKYIKRRFISSKELLLCIPEDNEMYGQISATKGDARFEVKLIKNNAPVLAKARGALIKGPQKKRLEINDYVLLQKDTSSNLDKYYIIHKYSPDDIKKLKKSGQLFSITDYKDNYDSEEDNETTKIVFEEDCKTKTDEFEIDDSFIASI